MTLRKETKVGGQTIELFFKCIRRALAPLINRADQFVHRNRVADAAAVGLLLASLVSVAIAIIWQNHGARMVNARVERLGDRVRQLADLRRVNYYAALDNPLGSARVREGRGRELKSGVPGDFAEVRTSLESAMEAYRDAAEENQSTVPATHEELAVTDNPRNRTYQGNLSMTYVNPGGVFYVTNVDPAALGPNAGDYLALINKPQAALDAFRKKLAIDQQAVAANPGNLQAETDLAYSSSRIGDLLAQMGDQAGALPYYQQAVDAYTKDAAADPADVTVPLQLARSLAKLAKTHTRLGYTEKAWAECNKAVDLVESVADDPANVEQRQIRASAYGEIGDAYSLLAQDTRTPQQFLRKLWASAREMYNRSFAILNDLRQRGVLNPEELTQIDAITQKIAECDLFLAK